MKGPCDGFRAEDLSIEVGEEHLAMGLSEGCLAMSLSEGCLATDLGEGSFAKDKHMKDRCRWIFVINIRIRCDIFIKYIFT